MIAHNRKSCILKSTCNGESVTKEDKETIWGKYLQRAAIIPGFIWGCIINLKGGILKISSLDYASEAFEYTSILHNIEALKEDCLANIDIGLPAIVQIRTKKETAFFARCLEKDEFFLSFFASDAPVESIPASIIQIIQE